MTIGFDTLERADFFRFDSLGPTPTGEPRKEWHHFIVHGDGARLIINLSIADRVGVPDPHPVPRQIVLVHHGSWAGWIDELDADDFELGSSGLSARFGESSLSFYDGAYDLELHLPESGVHGRLRFTPLSKAVIKNNQKLGQGRFTWLFVPRLSVDGYLWAGGVRFTMRQAPAYHDHNWGRFSWGDDFGWEWGSVLAPDSASPWSLVFWRMTDRGHVETRGQGLTVWHEDETAVMFRDTAVRLEHVGMHRLPPHITLPPAMALVRPGTASGLPSRTVVSGKRGDDEVEVAVTLRDYGRIIVPSDDTTGPDVVLQEVSCDVVASGTVAGRPMEMRGTGVFEYLQ